MAMIPYREAFAPLSSERPPSALSDPFDEAIAVLPTLLGRLRSEEDARPVVGRVDPEALEVDLEPPEGPRPWTDVAEDLFRLLRDGPRTTTRAFFNQLFGGRMGSAVVADMLASFANQSMYTYKVAGPQVLVEEALLARMGELAGFTTSEGTFTPGGSLSNLVAIVLARNAAFPEAREEGLRGRTPVIYVSEESHYSIRKSAGILGLGRSSVRAVSVDARGRLEPGALAAAIRADQAAGLNPFLAVATAGTTVRGAFDPIDRMSEVCRAAGLWLHVDGALGGSLLLSRRGRELLRGIESADSLTWDAHKLLGVPLTASVLLVRHRGALEAALAEDASYLFHDVAPPRLDPGHRSLQCGRRNDALKLWAAWQRHGDTGLAARMDRCLGLAQAFAERVVARPELELIETPPSTNVCFDVPGVDLGALVSDLTEAGDAMVGTAELCGRPVVRWVAVNPDLELQDLDRFLDALLRHARRRGFASAQPRGLRGAGA